MDVLSFVLQRASDQGFTVLMLVIAVWWLNRGNGKLIASLNQERTERITTLENKVDNCEQDRSRLWDRLLEMARAGREPIKSDLVQTPVTRPS